MKVEKPSKLREIKETILGAIEMVSHVKDPGVQESFGKIMEAAKITKEIIESLKAPEMVKNIENLRLISENLNNATEKVQDTIQQMKETGVIEETKELIKSAKNTMSLVTNTGQDLREVTVAIKEIFKSIRTAQNTVYNVTEKYHRPNSVPSEIVVTASEVEEYLNLGWQYVRFLPNGKVVIRKRIRHNDIGVDWVADLSESCTI